MRYKPNIYLRDPAQPNEASFARPFWSDSQGGAASSLLRPLAPVARYLSLKIHRLPGVSTNGASRDRTGDLLLAKQALFQLSYGPVASPIYALQSGLPILAAGPRPDLESICIAVAVGCRPFSVIDWRGHF